MKCTTTVTTLNAPPAVTCEKWAGQFATSKKLHGTKSGRWSPRRRTVSRSSHAARKALLLAVPAVTRTGSREGGGMKNGGTDSRKPLSAGLNSCAPPWQVETSVKRMQKPVVVHAAMAQLALPTARAFSLPHSFVHCYACKLNLTGAGIGIAWCEGQGNKPSHHFQSKLCYRPWYLRRCTKNRYGTLLYLCSSPPLEGKCLVTCASTL